MATLAEQVRAEQQRNAHPPKPKQAKPDGLGGHQHDDDSAFQAGATGTALRNDSRRAEERGGPVLEDSATGQPSRKSTRAVSGGVRTDTKLQLRAVRATTSPKARAARAAAKAR